jgi:hypothetical protein
MKHLLLAFLLVFLAVPTAFAIVTDRAPLPQSGDRIGILMMPEHLKGRSRAVVPTDVNIGIGRLVAWIAVPFIENAQYRAAAHDVARDAVQRIRKAE